MRNVHEQKRTDDDVPTAASIEPPADDLPGLFGSLMDVYREQGYERGYQRAVNDILDELLLATEDFVQERERERALPDARRLFYEFERFVEERLQRLSPSQQYVSGGLGI
jgi:hypothetical protein